MQRFVCAHKNLLAIFFVIAAINFLFFIVILASGETKYVVPTKSFGDIASEYHPEITEYFSKQLETTNIPALKGEAQLLELMKWVMNEIGDDTQQTGNDAVSVFEGGHAICGGMSLVFSAAAQSLGYKSREIDLFVSPGNLMDTHAFVEVYLDGRWQIFDPTFNVTYVDEAGQNLGAQEVQNRLLRRGGGGVEALFHGQVIYPVRLESYYVNWRAVFGTVTTVPKTPFYTRSNFIHETLRRLPFSGYFMRPNRYYLTPDGKIARYMKVHNFVYVLAYLVLPLILIVIFLVLAGRGYRDAIRRR